MNGASVLSTASFGLVWRDNSGDKSIWYMNGTALAVTGVVGNVATNWTIQALHAD
jgi:hypothetical protein